MAVNIISSILIWGAAAIIILRVLAQSGMTINSDALAVLTKNKSLNSHFDATNKETAAVFGLSLLFRFIVFIISIFAIYIVQDRTFSFNDLLNTYLQWDANNYMRIAEGGYSFYTENGLFTTLAFFPLYPWLIKIVNILFNDMMLSGIVVSSLLYSGACAYMYKLLAMDFNKSSAIRAIVYISVFPHALFFGVAMNESTLLFTMTATLYYIRRHNWKLVGLFGALSALSRMVGILVALPAAIEWFEYYRIFDKLKSKSFKEVWELFYKKALFIAIIPVGTLIYLYCNYRTTGDWFAFLELQEKVWHNGFAYFGKGIQTIVSHTLNNSSFTAFSMWLPQIISVIFVIACLIYGLRRVPDMYTGFLLIYIIINTGFQWPISVARYMTCAIPAFVILSDFTERHKWTEPLITSTMAILFGVFFVGYFMSRQIL